MTTTKNNRRVVVTGMGWVTPLGHDVDTVWKRLLNSESGMGPTTRFDARTFPTNFSAEVRNYTIQPFVKDASVHATAGLNSQFALGAASQAWRQSGLEGFAGLNKKRIGLYLGAGEGVIDSGHVSDLCQKKCWVRCALGRGEKQWLGPSRRPSAPFFDAQTRAGAFGA
jgi:3-oxoacyl-[acyl-carrier-protein] synthase II